MKRFIVGACAVAFCALPSTGPTPSAASDLRALPMQFELRVEGPSESCRPNCRTWVSATGAITADTPRDFDAFAKNRNIRGATLVLDSDGGSVLGALALGRAVRRLGMITTVGRTVDLPVAANGERRAQIKPQAYCESMCAFVLLAGVERRVPAEARVLVHQIWLGDRRDDPTAANYSAEDLVLVQRDIGRLAQYTVEMGGAIDLLETALKIPPWEPMRLLSREELRGMKIITAASDAPEVNSGTATASLPLANGNRAAVLQERSWVMSENAGRIMLTRRHPLTVEGEEIGSFDLTFACGEPGKDLAVTYVEQRRGFGRKPGGLTEVEISLSGKSVPLKVVSSQPGAGSLEFNSTARGRVPADLFKTFADPRSRSILVETASVDQATAIRIGNAGMARGFQQLAAHCGMQPAIRSTARTELRREAEAQPR
jgi:hypothetical protein